VATGQGTDKIDLLKKGVQLEYITIGWNMIGAILAGVAGIAAGSIALISFGLVSIIGVIMAGMLLLGLRNELQGQKSKESHISMERKVLFSVGVAFFLLALYIMNESGSRLYYGEKPDTSTIGLVLSILSLVVMPILAVMKFRAARGLKSRALRIDARETAVCTYLAFTLFLGISLHTWLGWWWADSVAALLMLPLMVREGWEAVEGSKRASYESGTSRTSPS
jgi:divalent metal cation (Fe/Co/Zn/Cd) transporter